MSVMESSTKILRRLLDERGVEYEAPHAGFTIVRMDKLVCKYYEMLEEPERGVFAVVTTDYLTPEQAIAATLGSCNCTNSERTDATRLPHFWTHDGVLHIEATRMPTRIVVCEGGTCEFVPKRELDASEYENAKLRELVRAAWRCIHTGASCSDCRLIAGGCTLQTAMRELGVEVDG